MTGDVQSGFTIWLRVAGAETPVQSIAEQIAIEFGRRGIPVEQIDAAKLAREAYFSKSASKGVAQAVAMTANALNRHSVAVIIFGAKSSAKDFAWKKRKPERMLEVLCLADGEKPGGVGPHLVLRPSDSPSYTPSPDPPSVARIGEDLADENVNLAGEQAVVRFNTTPLFEALEKAGWIPAESAPSNGDDDLLRKRLRDLGYL